MTDALTMIKDYVDELRKQNAKNNSHWKIGANYIIRTVTMTNTGRLVAVTDHELVLEDAAWIADAGRWADTIKVGLFVEVEPFPDGMQVIVGRGALIDAVQIPQLPRKQV